MKKRKKLFLILLCMIFFCFPMHSFAVESNDTVSDLEAFNPDALYGVIDIYYWEDMRQDFTIISGYDHSDFLEQYLNYKAGEVPALSLEACRDMYNHGIISLGTYYSLELTYVTRGYVTAREAAKIRTVPDKKTMQAMAEAQVIESYNHTSLSEPITSINLENGVADIIYIPSILTGEKQTQKEAEEEILSLINGPAVIDNIIIPEDILELQEKAFRDMLDKNVEAPETPVVNTETGEIIDYKTCLHTWEMVSYHLPGCYDAGVYNKKCTKCGAIKTVFFDAVGHEDELVEKKEATCEKDGYEKYVCLCCGREDIVITSKATGHKIIEESTEATFFKDGQKIKKCETCSFILEQERIPSLYHLYETPIQISVGLFLFILIFLILFFLRKKRKKTHK